VVLLVEKFRHIAEVNIVGDRLNIHGKEETNDMYSAIDMVIDKIEKQIKRTKEKRRTQRTGKNNKGMAAPEPEQAYDDKPSRVKVKRIHYKPMDVEEAMMQMDLGKDSFLVFTHARSNQVNVLYRRNDNDYGLIQPD